MSDKTAKSIAECLVTFMGIYGQVLKLHLDLGLEFKAQVNQHLCRLGSAYTMLYTPWSNGMVERVNRTIKHLLKVYCKEQLNMKREHIWCLMQAYNTTIHVSTGFTAFVLMHSRCENPDLPLDILYTSRWPDLLKRPPICVSLYLLE